LCSSVAIAGMPFESGRDFLLADEPSETAEAVKLVLRDEGLARSLAASALGKVRELYAADTQELRTAELVTRLISIPEHVRATRPRSRNPKKPLAIERLLCYNYGSSQGSFLEPWHQLGQTARMGKVQIIPIPTGIPNWNRTRAIRSRRAIGIVSGSSSIRSAASWPDIAGFRARAGITRGRDAIGSTLNPTPSRIAAVRKPIAALGYIDER